MEWAEFLRWEVRPGQPGDRLSGADRDVDRHVFFVLGLLLTWAAVRYQVGRLRTLSRFFASRRPPWLRQDRGQVNPRS